MCKEKYGEALANRRSPWYTECVERCCRRTVASLAWTDYSVVLGEARDGVIFLYLKRLFISMVLDQRNDGTEYQDETEKLRISNIHAHHLPRPVSENAMGEEVNRPP